MEGLANRMRTQAAPEYDYAQEQMKPEGEGGGQGGKKLAPMEELQGDIAYGITGSMLYSPEASGAFAQALQGGGDPTAITANFVSQLILKSAEKLQQTGPDISPNVWMSKNGVAERLIESAAEIAEVKAGMEFTPEMKQKTFMEIADIMKAGAQATAKGQQQPQGGPPMGGGMGAPMGGQAPMPQMGPPQQMPPGGMQ